jgi:hypothetical protein
MIIRTFQLFFAVSVGALLFVFAVSFFCVIFAELRLVFGLDLVFGVPELAGVALAALVFEEVSADAIALQPEEFLHLGLLANVDVVDSFGSGGVVEDGDKGGLYLF